MGWENLQCRSTARVAGRSHEIAARTVPPWTAARLRIDPGILCCAGGGFLLALAHPAVLGPGHTTSDAVAFDRDYFGQQRYLRGCSTGLPTRRASGRRSSACGDRLPGCGISGLAALCLAEPGTPRILSGAKSVQLILLHVHGTPRRAPDRRPDRPVRRGAGPIPRRGAPSTQPPTHFLGALWMALFVILLIS